MARKVSGFTTDHRTGQAGLRDGQADDDSQWPDPILTDTSLLLPFGRRRLNRAARSVSPAQSSPHSWSRRQTSHLQERREKGEGGCGGRGSSREEGGGRRQRERSHWPSEASNLALGTKGGRRGQAATWPTRPLRPVRGGRLRPIRRCQNSRLLRRSRLRQSNTLSRKSPSLPFAWQINKCKRDVGQPQ